MQAYKNGGTQQRRKRKKNEIWKEVMTEIQKQVSGSKDIGAMSLLKEIRGYIALANESMRRFITAVQKPNNSSSGPLDAGHFKNIASHK
ncbi:hypothetical protein SESBI_38236 [Sesbania bispinosa]|nr:hypothetical protein SESBI_38236 [Sesbania bispinosa]